MQTEGTLQVDRDGPGLERLMASTMASSSDLSLGAMSPHSSLSPEATRHSFMNRSAAVAQDLACAEGTSGRVLERRRELSQRRVALQHCGNAPWTRVPIALRIQDVPSIPPTSLSPLLYFLKLRMLMV